MSDVHQGQTPQIYELSRWVLHTTYKRTEFPGDGMKHDPGRTVHNTTLTGTQRRKLQPILANSWCSSVLCNFWPATIDTHVLHSPAQTNFLPRAARDILTVLSWLPYLYLYLQGGQHAVQRWGRNQFWPNAQPRDSLAGCIPRRNLAL